MEGQQLHSGAAVEWKAPEAPVATPADQGAAPMDSHAFLAEQQPGAAESHLPSVLADYNHDQAVHMPGTDQQQLQQGSVEQPMPVYQYQDVPASAAPAYGPGMQPSFPASSAVADLGAALRRGGAVGEVPRQLYQHEAMLENTKKSGTEVTRIFVEAVTKASRGAARDATFLPSHKSCPWHVFALAQAVLPPEVLQGPKSYNDALAKKYGRKKGDMGSSSAGVKDRGIFPSVEFRNPDHPRDVAEIRAKLGPLLVILASRNATPDTVLGELRRVRNGWIEADYRAWLKSFNPDKRPRLSHGYPQGERGGGNAASSDEEYEDLNNTMANPLNSALMGLPAGAAQQPGFPATAGGADATAPGAAAPPAAQQAAATLEAALRKRGSPDAGGGGGGAGGGSAAAPRPATSQSTGAGDVVGAGSEAGGEEQGTPSTIDILRLFVDASYQKGIVTRSQVQEMMAFVEECYNVPLPAHSPHLAWQHPA